MRLTRLSKLSIRLAFLSLGLCFGPLSEVASADSNASAKIGAPESGLQQSCQSFTKIKPFAYCIYHDAKSKNPDIVYYMHGAGGNEKRWLEHWRSVREAWRKHAIQPPTVISISYGPIWLLAEKSTAKASGLFEFTLTHSMPMLEKIAADVTGLKGGRRMIMGESMGGFNTAQLVMKHPELFARAAVLCPAMHEHTPFVGEDTLKKFAAENQTTLAKAVWVTVMERIFFNTLAQWSSAEPFSLGARLLTPKTPPLYISNALYDHYGFYQGTKHFAALAQQQGVPVQYEEVDGDHCKFNAQSLGAFLTAGP